jgi:SNF2 family DNA or RNA helicase
MSIKTVGSIQRIGSQWQISCAAYVRTKIRRLFPEVAQWASDTISLSDNIENCRDLLWFIDRYPMDVDDIEYLRSRSQEHVIQNEQIITLLDSQRHHREFKLAKPAREYQQVAASLLMVVKGLLLADDVGLGKTASSICAMCLPENLPALVVTLTHLPTQIQKQLSIFAPELKTHILKSGKPYPLSSGEIGSLKYQPFPDVIICNYAKLNGWAELLKGVIRYVVFDEIQELRTGEGSLKYQAAQHIASGAILKIGLSATPIYNYGAEFFNVVDILRPGCLGSKAEFLREWCIDDKKIRDTKAFGEYLRDEGIMLRRTRADVSRELPPVDKIHQYIESDVEVLDRIKGNATELAKIILASHQEFKGQKFRAVEEFNILMRQATGIAKAPYVAEFVSLLIESGQSVVLYGWHREVYSIWLERLAQYHPVMYTGTESVKEKDRSKAAFLNEESKLFIISLRAGAGLDELQYHPTCASIVFGELDWSYGVHEQCIGRLYRDGQTKNIAAYFLIAESGSDPIMADVIGIKRGQIEGVRDPNAALFEKLNVDGDGIKKMAESYLNGQSVKKLSKTVEA